MAAQLITDAPSFILVRATKRASLLYSDCDYQIAKFARRHLPMVEKFKITLLSKNNQPTNQPRLITLS